MLSNAADMSFRCGSTYERLLKKRSSMSIRVEKMPLGSPSSRRRRGGTTRPPPRASHGLMNSQNAGDLPRRAILTINEDKLVLYEDEELQEAEDALRKESSGSRSDSGGGSLPSINSGLHSLAEFFTGLRTLRAEQDGSGCSCKLVAGVYDDALADIGVAEGSESPDELNALFALRDFLRENLKTSEVAELHLAIERGNRIINDIESGRASPTEGESSGSSSSGGGGGGGDSEVQDVPPDPFGGDVNMNAVANKLSELAALMGNISFGDDAVTIEDEEIRSRKSSVDFYESEGGNEALAAGMFDLAVVVEELSPRKDASASASASAGAIDGDGGGAGAAASGEGADGNSTGGGPQAEAAPTSRPRSKPLPRGVTLLSVDDNYRPRTSSKAKEPVVILKAKQVLSTENDYRPRTSSKAKEPGVPDGGAGKPKVKSVSSLSTDYGYRPRTSSNAKPKDHASGV